MSAEDGVRASTSDMPHVEETAYTMPVVPPNVVLQGSAPRSVSRVRQSIEQSIDQ